MSNTKDDVNSPRHYKLGNGIEAIDIIDSVTAGYRMDPTFAYYIGSILKYLSRAPHKGSFATDILKAQWYLNRLAKIIVEEEKH